MKWFLSTWPILLLIYMTWNDSAVVSLYRWGVNVMHCWLTEQYQLWSWKVEASWNVTAHAQKPDFAFRRNGQVHLNRRGRQFSRLLAAEVCASAVVMLDTPCSEVLWRVLATRSIRQFPLHFPSRASSCAITFQLDPTTFLLFSSLDSSTVIRSQLSAPVVYPRMFKNDWFSSSKHVIGRGVRP